MVIDQSKSLLLIDGSSYLFRAYHALPPLTGPGGEPTGALYGVVNMMKKCINDYKDAYIAVVFDPKGPTTRHGYYPEYKANREAMPDELAVQIAPIHEMIDALGLPIVVVPGIEADDVIGTLANEAKAAGLRVVISTGDKDMAQLVDDQVSLVNTMKNTTMDAQGVMEKFGVRPDQVIDYLALMGDAVDHIPGIPKVGPKTAAKWLNAYGSLDALMARADEVKGKVGESLRTHQDQLPMSKRLVTIDVNIALPITVEDCVRGEENRERLAHYCQKFGFKRWLAEYQDAMGDAQQEAADYDCILTKSDFNRWLRRLHNAPSFALDTETDGLNAHDTTLVGLSFAVGAGQAAYVPLAHDYEGAPEQLDRQWVLDQLAPLLADEERVIIGQNIKFDLNVLSQYGVVVSAQCRDTMIQSYVLSGGEGPHDMDHLAMKCLGVATTTYESVVGRGAKAITFNQVPCEEAARYAAEDADITWQLDHVLMERLEADDDLSLVYEAIDNPLVPVLARMEQAGVLLDADGLRAQGESLHQSVDALTQSIYRSVGRSFNIDSTKQLRTILFEELALPVMRKTPKGSPSTAESALQMIANQHEVIDMILHYRSLAKLLSTYVDRLPEEINPRTHRVHTSYNQAVTSTGRLSSTNPNLQNIPVRTPEGRRIREAFVARPGWVILAADYSQIELRIMAHLSEDKNLLAAFEREEDVHCSTASKVYGVPLEEVTDLQRRHAKAVNFGLIYGMSAYGLSQQLKTSRDQAQALMDAYFAQYPGVLAYMDATRLLAREQGYVQTLFGRRMMLPQIYARQVPLQKAAERAAINAPMQGTAADIIKIAMGRVDAWMRDSECEGQMIMQVHDELVFELPEDEVALMQEELPELMGDAVELMVPLGVSIGVGANWEEAH